jgi:uncharacterized membrane protein
MQDNTAQPTAPSWRHVATGRGVQWWSDAWHLLFNRGSTGNWIAIGLVAFVLLAASHFVPLIGWLAAQLGWFVFAGGMMIAARKSDHGEAVLVGDLFAGFGPAFGSLVLAAILLMVALWLVFGALLMAGIGAAFGAGLGGLFGGIPVSINVLAGVGMGTLLLLLVGLVLMIPIAMAAWLSPALIALRQQPPVEALKSSLAACWDNLGPLTVYGLLWIGFSIIASIPLMLGWLVLMPLTALSSYVAYKDLFEQA